MITWEDTISIIKAMFEVREKEIAKHLEVSVTAFSHVKRGHRPPSDKFNPSSVYRKIFNPTEKGSMAACDPKYMKPHRAKPENIEKEYLSDLKRIIEIKFPNVQSDMAYCWNVEDYRTFVLELLKLTNLGTNSKRSSNSGDEPVSATDLPLDSSSSQAVNRSEPGEAAESKAVSQSSDADTAGGAQLHIEDKYKCCRFCSKWRGVMGDELSICRVFKEQRDAASGRNCKYYKPNWGRMTIEMM